MVIVVMNRHQSPVNHAVLCMCGWYDTCTVLDSDVYLCNDMCCQQNSQNNIHVHALLFMGICIFKYQKQNKWHLVLKAFQ